MGTLTAPQTDAWKNQGRETTGEFGTKLQGDPEILPLAPVETVFTRKYEKHEKGEQQAAFHAELKQKVASLDTDENWHNYLNTMSSFHSYSMSNQMLIAIQCPGASLVAGMKKWNGMDRSVIAGQRAIRIFGFSSYTKTEKDADGKPKLDANGDQVKTTGHGYPVLTVFDVSQTHGKPLPEAYEPMTEEPPAGFIDDLEESIRAAGFTVSYEEIPGAGHGFTDPSTNRVVVDETLTPAGRARTLAHERGHIALGHLERMDEYHTGHNGARSAMEVEAESFAYVVCRANGMSTSLGGQSATYVAGWAGTDKDALEKSAAAIALATKTVLKEDLFVARDWARDLERNALVGGETAIAVADWEVEHAAERVILEAGWAAEKLAKAAARAEKAAAKAAAK